MKEAKLAAVLAAVLGMTCLAMAPQSGPAADTQEAGAPAMAPKATTTRAVQATDPPSAPATATEPAGKATRKSYAMGDRQTKAFPDLDLVIDQVTRDLQQRIDADAKQIERKLMHQSKFRLGP